MKVQKILFWCTLLLIVIGCILPLYEIDYVTRRCSIIAVIALIFNCILIGYIYLKYKKYINLIIIPEIISLVYFIIIWSDIEDNFSLMTALEINYKYGIGFYFLLAGTFSSIIIYIIYIRKLIPKKEKVKVTYTTNKTTGSIVRHETRS